VDGLPFERYEVALADYLLTQREHALYEASLLSQVFVEQRAGPDEIVALHFECLNKQLRGLTYRQHARAVSDAHQFLLEVMIAYGVTYREYLDLKVREHGRDTAAREDILAMIAHELRTPITTAQVSLDLATRHLQKGRVEKIPPRIGMVRGALDRLSRLTANLVRSGQPELFNSAHERVELLTVIDQACEWAQVAAEEKGVAFDKRASGIGDAVICGDVDALLSVFGNLLSNAIRYTPAGGRVTLQGGTDSSQAWIDVVDTGIGMSEEVLARIFDRFYRGVDARSLEIEGLGLGLTLVRDAVAAHAGTVEVQSEPGAGSTFRVVLPLAPPNGCGGDNLEESKNESPVNSGDRSATASDN
jgi:signal transduction histidine kinase